MSENSENARYNFLQPYVTSSNVLFCLTSSLKHKDIQFTITFNHKSSHLRSWNQHNFGIFALKMTKMINRLSKWLQINFLLIACQFSD